MKLLKLNLSNFRNLSGVNISFSPVITFIVGENNTGKSNLLYALNRIFIGGSFSEQDFLDRSKPISIQFTLSLNEEEIGLFDDLCDPVEINTLNIIAVQESPEDSYIRYFHKETETQIPPNAIRGINLIGYDSLRNPKNEISFDKTKGAAAVLNYIIDSYIRREENEDTYLDPEAIRGLRDYIDNLLGNLSGFERFDISPRIEENTLNMLSRIFILKDSNNVLISETGYGVQFNLLIFLSIFEKIVNLSKKNSIRNEENASSFTSLLIFDEPEIHLHPYLQRSIIKDIIDIASNKDDKFNALLQELFGIKDFNAQIIVVTHSANILSNDYTQIVRMYSDQESVKVVNGIELKLDIQKRKHLLMQFQFVKEAIFSRCIIIVEGDSEYGCFREFGMKMGVDFDRLGIALIKAGGADSILPLIKLFSDFGIRCVGVMDKDKKIEKGIPDEDNLFFTKSKCFDSEIVESIMENDTINTLEKILTTYDSQGKERKISKNRLNNAIDEYSFDISYATDGLKFSEINHEDEFFKVIYTAWFSINKGVVLGKMIGEIISEEEIPLCYKEAIQKAKELSE